MDNGLNELREMYPNLLSLESRDKWTGGFVLSKKQENSLRRLVRALFLFKKRYKNNSCARIDVAQKHTECFVHRLFKRVLTLMYEFLEFKFHFLSS